jgi:hypothetical protein
MKWAKFLLVPILVSGLAIDGETWARGGSAGGGRFRGGHWGGGFRGGKYVGGPRLKGGYYFGRNYYGGYPYHRFRGYSNFGLFIGPSFGWPYSYYPYYPYYPAYPYAPSVTVIPSSPPVYIQQGNAPPPNAARQDYSWYYCGNPQGYYPHVKDCPGGWQKLAAAPPGQDSDYWYYCDNPRGYYPYVKDCSAAWKKIFPNKSKS